VSRSVALYPQATTTRHHQFTRTRPRERDPGRSVGSTRLAPAPLSDTFSTHCEAQSPRENAVKEGLVGHGAEPTLVVIELPYCSQFGAGAKIDVSPALRSAAVSAVANVLPVAPSVPPSGSSIKSVENMAPCPPWSLVKSEGPIG
jgi:hypothetical protein